MVVAANREHPVLLTFDGFTLDLRRRGLYKGDERIHLTPKPLETLIYLVENRGRIVEKQELMEAVWKDTFVTEDNLVHAVGEIRRALGDDKDDPCFIQTVPRQGYRFVSEVALPARAFQTAIDSVAVDAGRPKLYLATKRGNKHRLLVVSAVAIVVAGICFGIYMFLAHRSNALQPRAPFEKTNFARLTTTGNATRAVLSPDGRYFIYVQGNNGEESIWIKQVATASNVQVAAPAKVSYQGLTLSPDGNHIYYLFWDGRSTTKLYQMPAFGGAAREILVDIDSPVTFSPDGKQFAFLRGYPDKSESALMIANDDGGGERVVAIRKLPDYFPSWTAGGSAPAWSPDGQLIVSPAGGTDGGGRYATVVAARLTDRDVVPVTSQRWWQVGRIAWLPDGSGMILTARKQESSPSQIWHLSYPGGQVRQITNDLNNYVDVNLTADATALVAVQTQILSNIWVVSQDREKAQQLTFSNVDGMGGISWSPNGQIVYASRAGGNQDIWTIDANGDNQKQLTVGIGNNNWPSVTPDGRYIVFVSQRAGVPHLWRMDLDGTNVKQLTNGDGEDRPSCSPDGKWVVYRGDARNHTLWKVPIDGSEPVQVNQKPSGYPAISPDGKLIATIYSDDPTGIKTAIYSMERGELLRTLDIWSYVVHWSSDGRALAYINRRGVPNIVSQSLAGGLLKELTHFKTGGIQSFDWSRDGKLALARSANTSDVVMIKSEK